MEDTGRILPLPEEPADLKAEARALLEESPDEGTRFVNDAEFVAGLLWEEWDDALEGSGMDYGRFLEIARGYAGELRLWVVGERPWEHCVSGFAGRVLRRLPTARSEESLACAGACG